MAWVYLLLAGLLEVVWAYSMKRSDGFTLPGPTALTIAGMIASFWLLSLAMRSLPLTTAYPIWTGIGAVGAFIMGITLLGEAVSLARLLACALIIAGITLLKLTGGAP